MAKIYMRCVLYALLLLSPRVNAADVHLKECPSGRLLLTSWIDVKEDPSGSLSLSDVNKLAPKDFLRFNQDRSTPGYSASAFWMRTTIHNDTKDKCSIFLLVGPARLQNVQLYTFANGKWQASVSGTAYPLKEWALPARMPVFPLQIPAFGKITLTVRAQGKLSLSFNPQLLSEKTFLFDRIQENIIDGVALGSVFLLVLFSFILSRVMDLPVLRYIALEVLFYTGYMMVLEGYAFVYLWPNHPQWNAPAGILLVSLCIAYGNAYICSVININRLGPFWRNIFLLFRLIVISLGLLQIIKPFNYLATTAFSIFDFTVRLLFVMAVLIGIIRGWERRWFPPILVSLTLLGFISRHSFIRNFKWLDQLILYSPKMQMAAGSLLPGATLLAVTLISQVIKSRRRELQARLQLDQQIRDEQDRLESTVRQRTWELDAALQARSSLLMRISHDLRSPLASIIEDVREWKEGGSRYDYSKYIESSARQQLELIDELIELSRAELGKIEIIPAPGFLYGFLKELSDHAQKLCKRHNNELVIRYSEALPPIINADLRRLRQILVNLLGNAAKFTFNGQVVFEVSQLYIPERNSAKLLFSVSDSGIGIEEHDRGRILHPFIRGSNVRHQEGTGLGLAIVTQLLSCMDSKLNIQASEFERGSQFSFVINVSIAEEDDVEYELEASSLPGTVSGHSRAILVVDHRQKDREMICDFLDGLDFITFQAPTIEDAERIINREKVDLVLTNKIQPKMYEWRFLLSLRSDHPNIPAVLYSATPSQRPQTTSEELDFDGYLFKPLSGAELLNTIDALVAPKTLARA